MTHRSPRPWILALVGLALAAAASAQSWEYKSYKKGPTGQYSKEEYVSGTVTVYEKNGKSYLRIVAGNMDACRRSDLETTVTKTEATTIIEPQIELAGCEKFRYVIRNDGSGGHREVWRGDKWSKTSFDHGLTPVK